jgi:hypothetical protein
MRRTRRSSPPCRQTCYCRDCIDWSPVVPAIHDLTAVTRAVAHGRAEADATDDRQETGWQHILVQLKMRNALLAARPDPLAKLGRYWKAMYLMAREAVETSQSRLSVPPAPDPT